ncbi:ribokinase [candidate division KSB1 bacterium]|nr:ribokinase [candidate division KSB1 bacterium]MBL7093200.1 ribokinase [candidate division KSB1 bacterium]
MDKAKIVVVGSSNTDMIIKVPRIPKPGETILGGKFLSAAGGKGANQAVAAARAGGSVSFIARVGEDMFGDKAVEGFIADKINVDYIIKDKKAPSGVAEIFVDDEGENSIAVASGANLNLSPQDIIKAKNVISSSDILVMQLEIPLETVNAAAQIANECGVKVILNPAPAQPLDDSLFQNLTILTPNESESELLTGILVKDEKSAEQAARVLIAKGVDTVIVTMGSKGALLVTADVSEMIPGYKVEAVDATAAGDVFNGALSVALAEKKSLKNGLRFANAAAALSVTKLGAQPSAPQREDVEKLLWN